MNKKKEMWIASIILIAISIAGILGLQGGITGSITENLANKELVGTIDLLFEAEKDILELKRNNLTTLFFQDMLLDAKRNFLGDNYPNLQEEFNKLQDKSRFEYSQILLEDFTKIEDKKTNHSKVLEITNNIKKRKQLALEILDKTSLLEQREKEAKGINTEKVLELVQQSKISLREERYEEALTLLEEAQTTLDKENREYLKVAKLTKNFFQNYWLESVISLILLLILAYFSNKKIKKIKAKNKLKSHILELESLSGLMKKAQEDRFREKNMSATLYKNKMEKYKTRKNKIKAEIPVLKSLLGIKQKEKKKEGALKI